jgi:hypothetical protein
MRKLLLILVAVAIAGCSTTRLAYNRLDWIAGWQISGYVGLDDVQREQFDAAFAMLWRWHRQQELPQYATDLEGLAAAVAGGHFDRATLEDSVRTVNAHAVRLYEQALQPAAALVTTLSDEQVAALRERVHKDATKSEQRYLSRGVDAWHDEAARNMQRSLRRWIGRPTPTQRERIERWARARAATPELWLAYRKAWTEDFFMLLEHRGDADFVERLRNRLEGRDGFRSEALVAAAAADREAWMALMMDLHAMLDPHQREQFVRELRRLAADFNALADEGGHDA